MTQLTQELPLSSLHLRPNPRDRTDPKSPAIAERPRRLGPPGTPRQAGRARS